MKGNEKGMKIPYNTIKKIQMKALMKRWGTEMVWNLSKQKQKCQKFYLSVITSKRKWIKLLNQ